MPPPTGTWRGRGGGSRGQNTILPNFQKKEKQNCIKFRTILAVGDTASASLDPPLVNSSGSSDGVVDAGGGALSSHLFLHVRYVHRLWHSLWKQHLSVFRMSHINTTCLRGSRVKKKDKKNITLSEAIHPQIMGELKFGHLPYLKTDYFHLRF